MSRVDEDVQESRRLAKAGEKAVLPLDMHPNPPELARQNLWGSLRLASRDSLRVAMCMHYPERLKEWKASLNWKLCRDLYQRL